ncbi:TIGR04255 family protein [Streptomyces sp. NPDC004592]
MYDRREIYDYAPLALVTAEVRYPYAPRLRQALTLDRIQLALEDDLPIRKVEQRATLELGLGGVSGASRSEVYRFLNKKRTCSAVISPEAFTIETTTYREFSDFRKLLLKVAKAVADEKAVPAVERIGLRYVDEVRVPEAIKESTQWAGWVAPSLLPQVTPGIGPLRANQGVALYEVGESSYLQFQYAAVDGAAVVGNEPLRRPSVPEPGPFFVLDIDCYWQAPTPEESADYSVEFLSDTLERIHVPTGKMFQASITDRARDLFRGK